MKTVFKNARILKMDDTPIFISNLVVDGNRIAYIGNDYKKYAPFDREIECNGNVIMPSFKNVHTHSAMTFLRSKADDDSLQEWLFGQMIPREEKLQEEDVYHLAKLANLEYLTSGISATLDQYYFPPQNIKACREMGMRLNAQGCYGWTNPIPVLEKRYKDINAENSLIKYSVGFHAEYTASKEDIDNIKIAVEDLKAKFHVHLSETKSEVENCLKNRGLTPAMYLDSLGLWNYGGVAYHCCYLTEEEIELFKKRNIAVVTCPGSNLKLASGIAPIRRYLDEGILVGIGTDGPASNNCLDMFKEMMLVINLAKIQTGNPNAISAYEVLKMATVNGAKIMGFDDADILEVGKLADIIELDMSRPSMQPINNIINNIVYSGSKDIVKLTMVDGKILYEDNKFFVGEDINDIYKKVQEITERIDREFESSKK